MNQERALPKPNLASADASIEELPDIYFILLDGYAREDVLQRIYGLDNGPFLSELRNLGFWIADRAQSAYGQTYLSVSSTLNMDYLQTLAVEADVAELTRADTANWITSNKIAAVLSQLDYEFVTFATGHQEIDRFGSDVYFRAPFDLSEFEMFSVALTPLPPVLSWFAGGEFLHYTHRRRIEYTLSELPGLAERPGRQFVYAHVLAPHPPFVLVDDNPRLRSQPYHLSDGPHFIEDDPKLREQYVELYAKQTAVLNGLVLEAVRGILRRSVRPPIIVIQSDHGPGSRLSWSDPSKKSIEERFSILSTMHLPGVDTSEFDAHLSAVNGFRIIFNAYLGANLPLHENKMYFSSWDSPFEFTDVTAVAAD